MEKIIGCSLCGKSIREIDSNNPYPLCDENDYESACCHKCNEEKVLPARGIDIIDAKKMRVIALANKKARKQTRDRWYYSSNKEDIWLEVKDDEV
jgi:hypothetical protein